MLLLPSCTFESVAVDEKSPNPAHYSQPAKQTPHECFALGVNACGQSEQASGDKRTNTTAQG